MNNHCSIESTPSSLDSPARLTMHPHPLPVSPVTLSLCVPPGVLRPATSWAQGPLRTPRCLVHFHHPRRSVQQRPVHAGTGTAGDQKNRAPPHCSLSSPHPLAVPPGAMLRLSTPGRLSTQPLCKLCSVLKGYAESAISPHRF